MTTVVRSELEIMIDSLHRDAATELAWAAHWRREAVDSAARYPWRRHDARIYRERAETHELNAESMLQAVKHLTEEL